LNVKGFDLDRILEHEPDFLKNGGHKHHEHKHEHKHHHEHDGKDHSHCDHEHGHCDHDHDHDHEEHEHTHSLEMHEEHDHDHHHDESVTSVGLTISGDLDPKKLEKWMRDLLQNKGPDIFRMKGILSIKNDPNRFVFQGVHMLFDGRRD